MHFSGEYIHDPQLSLDSQRGRSVTFPAPTTKKKMWRMTDWEILVHMENVSSYD